MKRTKITLLLLTALLLGSFWACRKFDPQNDLLGQEWNPALALPLLYTTVDIYDILKQSDTDDLLVINENTGLLALSYRGNLVSLSPNEIIQLLDQTDNFSISVPATTIPFSGSFSNSSTRVGSFSTVNGAELENIQFDAGQLRMSVTTGFTGAVEVAVHIPSLTTNGREFRDTIGPTNSLNLDLSGYTLDLSKGSQGFNEILFNTTTTISASAGTSIPNPAADISYSLENMSFLEVIGDFKKQTVNVDQDSILVKLFGNLDDVGSLKFSNPTVFIHADNSMGFPIRVDLQDIYSYNIISGDTFKLFIDTNEAFFDIAYPSIGMKGTSVQSSKSINSKNSTISRIVSPTPKYLITAVNAISNPNGVPTQNFITKDSYLDLETELNLPLEGQIESFNVRDTFPYEFSENIEEIDSILIRSNIINGFPLDAWVQVYFMDANYNTLDSLFPSIEENIVIAGDINTKGRVDQSNTKITDIVFSQSRVGNITDAKHVVLRGNLKTVNNGQDVVKIFDEYQISLKIGLMVFGAVQIGGE